MTQFLALALAGTMMVATGLVGVPSLFGHPVMIQFELQSYADPAAASVLACALVALVLLGQALLSLARRRTLEVR